MARQAQWVIVAGALAGSLGACAPRPAAGPLASQPAPVAALVETSHSHSGVAKSVRLSEPAGHLRFLFVSSHENGTERQISELVQRRLGSADVDLVLEPSAGHDATLEVRVRPARSSGCGGGDCPANSVQVELALIHDQQALDWFATAPISEDDARGLDLAITGLVGQLAASRRLLSLAENVKDLADRHPSEGRAHPGREGLTDDGTSEALAWNPSALRRCRNARSAEACDDLAHYLTSFPGGAHAQVAKTTLEQARARFGVPPVAPATVSVTSNARGTTVSDAVTQRAADDLPGRGSIDR